MATTLYRMGTGNGGGDEPTGKLVVTAEAGSTVHVLNTDTGVEMTKEAVGTTVTFIVEAGEIYEVWMSKTGQESAHVTTPAITMLVTPITLAYWKANIEVTVPSGATVTISNGLEKYTLTSNTTQEVHTEGTWTFTCVYDEVNAVTYKLDGVSTTTKSKSITTDGSTTTVDFSESYGFINVTTSDDFGATASITLRDSSGSYIDEKTPTNHTVKFVIAIAGSYYATSIIGSKTYKSQPTDISLGEEKSIMVKSQPTVVAFSTATDEQIAEICNAYYDDPTFLTEIEKIWAVDNRKTINGIEYRIIGIAHDDLSDDSGKALLTLQSVDIVEKRQMKSTNSNGGGWNGCLVRTYLNDTFFNGVKSAHPSLNFKTVKKLTSIGGLNSTINTSTDSVFLLSEKEIFGSKLYSYNGEGDQYAFYKNGGSKIKNFNGGVSPWWERSPDSSYGYFCLVKNDGSANSTPANNTNGVAPALCL